MKRNSEIVAFQLYSAHARPANEDILAMLAAAGYRNIETYGPWHDDPRRTRELADRHGLRIPSLHLDLGELRGKISPAAALAAKLGARLVVAPWLAAGERPADLRGWRELGRELNAMAVAFKPHGLKFAWHNHDFEFAAAAMSVLLDAAPDLFWQMDVGWTVRAGENVLAWLDAYGPRIAALHVKDAAKPADAHREDGWTAVGRGIADWPAIVARSRALGISHFVIEHDSPGDVAGFAKASLDYFSAL